MKCLRSKKRKKSPVTTTGSGQVHLRKIKESKCDDAAIMFPVVSWCSFPPLGVVDSGPFLKKLLHNHFITEFFLKKNAAKQKTA